MTTSKHFKNIITIILSCLLSLNALALELEFGKISPTVLAYQEQCQVDFKNKSLPPGWEKNFCEIVVQGPICKEVPKKYKRDCSVELETVNPLDAFGSCFDGFFNSLSEMWDFLTEAMSLLYDEEKRAEVSEEGKAFLDSLALYYETEVIKAKQEMSGPFKDTRAGLVAGKNLFIKILKDFLIEPLSEKYKQYACYNKEGAVHYTCETLTEYFFPPIAILTAIKKGKKFVKSFRESSEPSLPSPPPTPPSIVTPERRSRARWEFAEYGNKRIGKAYLKYEDSPINDVKPPRMGMAQEYKSESFTLQTPLKPISANIAKIDEHLKNGAIKKDGIKKLEGGITTSFVVELEDGTKGIFKPRAESDWASNYRAEVLAYEVDKFLDLDIVPPTVERTINNSKGSFQKFEDSIGDGFTHASFAKQEVLDKQNFFDLIIDNRDRHPGNYLITKHGNIHSIDHGLTFTGRGYNAKHFDEVKESISRFIKTQEGAQAIKKLETMNRDEFYRGLTDYLGPLDATRTMDRIDFLIKFSKD
ncbi:phosphatidylinositol 3- and 4-kinase [Bacteriovorax sp. DB6_IX]|uniref:phosphatidylinositol 3- and 4-kinase n=1 Tax=Bacteriovorax sp. DB6_IX TaxID=1353530 RepID=UPI00038A20E6|nr:phosphatidylinositol 3- and 4-kinase [Bacteriovorax sp. DB6_IX]EQC49037.1 phosphatidylinositol 3- and 4-kinase domain protein [Bacteriovorax sp. DB6_IX]